MTALAVIVFALLGGALSRWHGGGFVGGSPKMLKNFLWALPLAIGSYIATQSWMLSLIALVLCMFGKATGHGGGIDLGRNPKEPGAGRSPEKLEYLILWLHGRMPRYWYDALLLAIVGIAAVSGAILAMAFVNPVAALFVAIGGAMKGLAYMIGWEFEKLLVTVEPDDFNEPTELGEFLAGFFAYLAFALAFVMVV
jgi:hypothetical protein